MTVPSARTLAAALLATAVLVLGSGCASRPTPAPTGTPSNTHGTLLPPPQQSELSFDDASSGGPTG